MQRTRIMPAGHWDWSMPVKFSQGWSITGNVRWIFVGGQISADAHGRTIGAGDIAVQTRNVFESVQYPGASSSGAAYPVPTALGRTRALAAQLSVDAPFASKAR